MVKRIVMMLLIAAAAAWGQIIDTPEALFNSAASLLREGRPEQAWACLKRIDAEHEPRWLFLAGRASAGMGRYAQALKYFEEVYTIDPGWRGLHAERAGVYSRLGRFEEAYADYRRAMELNPGNGFLMSGAAYVLERLGRLEEAYALRIRANALREHPAGLFRTASLAERLGHFQTAHDLYRRAKELGYEPAAPPCLHSRAARVLYREAVQQKRLENLQQAAVLFERVHALYPDLVYGAHAARQKTALEWLRAHRAALEARAGGNK